VLQVQRTRDPDGAGSERVKVVLWARRRIGRIIGVDEAPLVIRRHVRIKEIVDKQRDLPTPKVVPVRNCTNVVEGSVGEIGYG